MALAKMSVVLLICCCLVSGVQAQVLEVKYFPTAVSKDDKRAEYVIGLLTLALEKTRKSDGPYQMIPVGGINIARAAHWLKSGDYVNVIWTTPTVDRENSFLPIRIPIRKGLLGYRVFLIQKQDAEKFSTIKTLEDLKRLSVGQGQVWNDGKVFKASGFDVVTGSSYEGLFSMLMNGRFDFFSRGINEAPVEYEMRKDKFPNLFIEESILLYYPWPKYFFTSKENPELADRIERGLRLMLQDGSFDEHLMKYHKIDIEKVNLKNRRLFKIDNPLLPSTAPLDQKELWFYPF